MSKSQLGQELEVIKFYNNKERGFFIEIGASDGLELSNTYLLETKYKWKGICCEPIPKKFEKLVKNRPNSICYKEAVYNQSGLILAFDISNSYDLLSGISDHIDKHKLTVDNDKTTVHVGLIDVEHNFMEPRRTEIRNLLLSKGYIYKGENNWDDMYKHFSV